MEPRTNNHGHSVSEPTCECCKDLHDERRMPRREFFTAAGGAVLGASAIASVLPAGRVWATPKAVVAATAAASDRAKSSPESLVKVLYEALSPKQRETICFPWDHQHAKLGLLRTRISANWNITEPFVADTDFYSQDQQAIIRGIFEGIISPEW